MSTQKLKVNIFGSEYVLKASENQEYLQKIAKYVDDKMKEIDSTQSLNSKLKVSILAALNIAEELFQEREYRNRLLEQLDEQARKYNRSLEKILE